MRIQSRIKAKQGNVREITVFGVLYRFEKQSDGSFVAEIDDPKAAECLLSGRDFWEYGKAAAVLTREPEKEKEKEKEKDQSPPDPVAIEAAALLERSVSEMGKEIGGVSGLAVLRAALALEQGDDGKKRKGVVSLLETAIESAVQAGVQE